MYQSHLDAPVVDENRSALIKIKRLSGELITAREFIVEILENIWDTTFVNSKGTLLSHSQLYCFMKQQSTIHFHAVIFSPQIFFWSHSISIAAKSKNMQHGKPITSITISTHRHVRKSGHKII